MELKLNNLEKIENKLLSRKDLSNKEKFTMWRIERKSNFDKIVDMVNKYNCHEFDENCVLIVKGAGRLSHPCPPRVMINGTNFYLYENFVMRISLTRIVIYFNDAEIFNVPFKRVTAFYWNGL